jgi:hypothetical protein
MNSGKTVFAQVNFKIISLSPVIPAEAGMIKKGDF